LRSLYHLAVTRIEISAAALCCACRLNDAWPRGASPEPTGRLFYLAGPERRGPSESYSDRADVRFAASKLKDEAGEAYTRAYALESWWRAKRRAERAAIG
jgi:hypothetical protein